MTTATQKIDCIETTNLNLTGRAGLVIPLRYAEKCGYINLLSEIFSAFDKSEKGLSVSSFFKQMAGFFFNGDNLRIAEFDRLQDDPTYANILECDPDEVASSSAIRRMFGKFNIGEVLKFRKIFRKMFRQELERSNEKHIMLVLDSMVLDNNDSKKKQACTPTYKNVLGFQPLHLIWGYSIMDMCFRGGKRHGNYADTAKNMIVNAIRLIREIKGDDFPIIFNMDSGFMDEKLFKAIEENGAYFICSGKKYKAIKEAVESTETGDWKLFQGKNATYKYYEFNSKCDTWDKSYRTIYTYLFSESDNQCIFNFGEAENVIYTNINKKNKLLPKDLVTAKGIISSCQSRGANELAHRGIKEFGIEQMPFKNFYSNYAFYAIMVICYNIFELYKRDIILKEEFKTSYANTIRRKFIDIAGYIAFTAGKIILKINATIEEATDFKKMWDRCNNPICQI